jgi:hypothetical protein
MIRKPHREIKHLPELLDLGQMYFSHRCRVEGRALQQNDLPVALGADGIDGLGDFSHGGHPDRQDDRPLQGRDGSQEREVRHVSGGDLVCRDVKRGKNRKAFVIQGRR